MPTILATTRLSAVNQILAMVGTAPITQAILDSNPLPPDAQEVVTILDNIDLAVQEQGWDWNTEARELYPEPDFTILTPDDAIDVHRDPKKEWNVNPIKRGSVLFDRQNRTAEFTESVNVLVIVRLPFEDLPEAARKYITIKAARHFASNWDNSELLYSFSQRDEADAHAALMKELLDSNSFGLGNTAEHASYKRFTR